MAEHTHKKVQDEDDAKLDEDEASLQEELHDVGRQREKLRSEAERLTKKLDEVRTTKTAKAYLRTMPEGARNAVARVSPTIANGVRPPVSGE